MAVLAIGITTWLVLAVVRISQGVNPSSLWLDDQWVGVLVRQATMNELLQLMPPAPLGFLLLLKTVTAFFGWGQWQLQMIPLVLGLLQIPWIGWLAWRMTGRVSLGILASGLLSGSSTLLVFSLRVKQYTLEGCVVLLLITLAMLFLRQPTQRRFTLLLIAAIVTLPFSFTAAPVGLIIISMLTLHVMIDGDLQHVMSRRGTLIWCAIYWVIALGWASLVQLRQANAAMYTFWSDHYAPLHDAAALWAFMRTDLARFATGAFAESFTWAAVLVPVAMVLLSLRRSTRLIALALLLFYGGMLAASVMQVYPIGGRRTDVFSFPISILAAIGAIWMMARLIHLLPQLLLAGVVGYAMLYLPSPPIRYAGTGGRDAVEAVQMQPGDGLIIALDSSWAVGCYADMLMNLISADESSSGFIVQPQRPFTLVLRESSVSTITAHEQQLIQPLAACLQSAPPRLYFISIRNWARSDRLVADVLEQHGYHATELSTHDRSLAVVFQKQSAAFDANE